MCQSRFKIDERFCNGCGECEEKCPGGVFVVKDGVVCVVNEEKCIKCFQCYDLCKAIKFV